MNKFWGYFGLALLGLIILFAISGCAQPQAMTSFRAVCAIAVLGKTEEGVTVVRQACEVE
jgi:hypothetical protein